MIIHISEIVKKAQRGNYGVAAFNTANLETTIGIVKAAVAQKSPIIIQVTEGTIKYAGLETIFQIIRTVGESVGKRISIAIHLDHGRDFKTVKACVDIGFSSVHMDASDLPFAQNIAVTKRAVDYAHKHGAWAQGELGSLIGKEGMTKIKLPKDPDSYMTDPAKAQEFVDKTGVDTLAISVGTMHGHFKGQEKIDFKRLTEIAKQVKTPLVLHGTSGVKGTEIKKAVAMGVVITNVDTDLRIAFTEALHQTLADVGSVYDPRKILTPSIEAVQKIAENKIKILGSNNKQ